MTRGPAKPETILEKLIERRAVEIGLGEVRSNWLDRAIGWVSPRMAARRLDTRLQMASSAAAFEGARRDRLFENWLGDAASSDAALIPALPLIRARARKLERDESVGCALVKGWRRGVIGGGLTCSPQVAAEPLGLTDAQADRFNRQAREWFDCFAQEASADRRHSFSALQGMIVTREAVDGEVPLLLSFVDQPGRECRTALELIEPERLDTPPEFTNDASVRGGIKLGTAGEMLGAYVLIDHPGEAVATVRRGERRHRYYPARDSTGRRVLMHFYEQQRANQSRGISMFASNMNRLHNLGQFLTGEEVAKRIESCVGMAIRRRNANTKASISNFAMEPGFIFDGAREDEITLFDPKRPGSNFSPYVEFVLRMIGSAWEMPLEVFMLDFSESSWSNARAALVEAYLAWQRKRAHLTGSVCQPVYAAVTEEGILRGAIEMPPGADFYASRSQWTRCEWIEYPRPWVDPENQVSAIEKEIGLGLTTKTIEARKRGRHYPDLVRERASEREAEEAAGLSPAMPTTTTDSAPPDEEDGGDEGATNRRRNPPAQPPADQQDDED